MINCAWWSVHEWVEHLKCQSDKSSEGLMKAILNELGGYFNEPNDAEQEIMLIHDARDLRNAIEAFRLLDTIATLQQLEKK